MSMYEIVITDGRNDRLLKAPVSAVSGRHAEQIAKGLCSPGFDVLRVVKRSEPKQHKTLVPAHVQRMLAS